MPLPPGGHRFRRRRARILLQRRQPPPLPPTMASPAQAMAPARACSPQSSTTAAKPKLLTSGGTAPGSAGRASALAVANRAGGAVKRREGQGTCAGEGDLVREFKNFKKSAAPSRVLLFAGGAWSDLPPEVVEALGEGFLAGRPIVEVPVGGSPCLFDFVRMERIDSATAAKRPIAWVDVHGRCFFPGMAAGGGPANEIEVRSDENGCAAPSEAPLQERRDENRVASGKTGGLDGLSWAGLQVLDERDKSYKIVEKIFLAGMRRPAPATSVTSIRRCCHGAGSSRLRAFQVWAEVTKAARGTDNLKHGWYGAPAAGVATVVKHGFGEPNNGSLRPAAQAVGVYIAPPYSPHASALMSDPDHAGERHVVLCRVIMGNAEKVDMMGAPRCHPSGDEFDSGVDDLEKPRWYIVWGTRMNTHILPEYVVSFRTSEAGGLLPLAWVPSASSSCSLPAASTVLLLLVCQPVSENFVRAPGKKRRPAGEEDVKRCLLSWGIGFLLPHCKQWRPSSITSRREGSPKTPF